MFERSLLDYLRALAAEEPEKRLIGSLGGWFDARKALQTVEGAGRSLVSLGVKPGDLAALRCDRCAETALLILALRAAGALVVLTDPRQTIDAALSESEAAIAPRFCIERREGRVFSVRAGNSETLLSLDDDAPEATLPAGDPNAPAFVIFTSGSTGKSKAVVQCENNYISNLLDTEPIGLYTWDDVALGALPLGHVFGLVLLAGVLVLGYALYYPAKTDIESLLACIDKERVTRMNGVPSLYLAMAERSAAHDLRSLRAGFIGGGPVTAEQFAHIEETLGMTLISVYGMSECVGISCASYRDTRKVRASGVGPVYPMNTLRIVGADGSEVERGQTGEITVRGPMRMLGYYGQPLAAEDFFATGDLGYLDETGVLHLSGRKKDIIIRNGNNLSARKIEDALLRLPGVRAAAVLGLPDEKQGELPYAMIVGEADVEALQAYLYRNEIPAGILSVEALPMTASGKPDRPKIREVLLQWRNS